METAARDASPAPASRKGLRRYDPALVPEVVAFQREAYPHRRADWLEPRWRWMYLDSASRLGVEPMVWVYHDGERVIAHQGAIPVRLWAGGGETVTGWFVETMALPSARGKTVGPAVIMKAAEDLPFALSLGQTAAMRELQYKTGWQKVVGLKTSQLLINPGRVLRGKIRFGPAAVAAGAAFGAWSRARRVWSRPRTGDFVVSEPSRFGERHDALWKDAARHLMCAVVRDASYLNWKYVDQPGQEFHRLELSRGGRSVSVAVLSIAEPDESYSYRRAFLVELVAPLTDRAVLLATIDAVRRRAMDRGAAALVCLHISRPLSEALASSGFLEREPTRYLLVRPGPAPPEVRSAALDPAAWYVTMGDSDIDRPW